MDYIEQQINNLEYITRGAVIAIDDEKYMSTLVAFVSLSNAIEDVENRVKVDLKDKLEYYNIPQRIYVVEEIPVLANGKIDSKKLEGMMTLL